MKMIEALASLSRLQSPIFRTRDAAACLNINRNHASKLLSRLGAQGLLNELSQSVWAFPSIQEPFLLPEYLTAPHPSYISLQSALYYHGIIQQIPQVIYAVSLSRSKRFETPLGTFSVHHIDASFFYGFESIGKFNIKMAVMEKALLDFLYLSANKTRFFSKLPEWEIPKGFSWQRCRKMAGRIPSLRQKTLVLAKLEHMRLKT